MTPLAIQLSPYLRITQAACDIDLKSNGSGQYRVLLKRGEEIVAVAVIQRTSNATVADTLRKAKLNLFGPTSAMHQALVRFADIAEALSHDKSA